MPPDWQHWQPRRGFYDTHDGPRAYDGWDYESNYGNGGEDDDEEEEEQQQESSSSETLRLKYV